jgi:hypothetical protein
MTTVLIAHDIQVLSRRKDGLAGDLSSCGYTTAIGLQIMKSAAERSSL